MKIPRKKKKWLKSNPMLPKFNKGYLYYYSDFHNMWFKLQHHPEFDRL